MIPIAVLAASAVLAVLLAAGLPAGESAGESRQFMLPEALREVSGLAVQDEQTILMHNDENAIIFAMDLLTGDLSLVLQLGNPGQAGDFEGIEVLADSLYLIDSKGHLYLTRDWQSQLVAQDFDVIDTGLGDKCEVEGLHAEPDGTALLIACKTMNKKKKAKREVSIYRYDIASGEVGKALTLEFAALGDRIQPSAIVVTDKELLLLAARQHALIAIDRETGVPLTRIDLDPGAHPQAEGLALVGERLVIADEGGKGAGRITIYPWQSAAPAGAP